MDDAATPMGAMPLQADIDILVTWSDTWQLPFNEEKCKALHLGSSNTKLKYTMRGASLAAIEMERDLGVLVDESSSSAGRLLQPWQRPIRCWPGKGSERPLALKMVTN